MNLNSQGIASLCYVIANNILVCTTWQHQDFQSPDLWPPEHPQKGSLLMDISSRLQIDHIPRRISSRALWLDRLLPDLSNCCSLPKPAENFSRLSVTTAEPLTADANSRLSFFSGLSQPDVYWFTITMDASKWVCCALTISSAIHVPGFLSTQQGSSSAQCSIYSLSSFRSAPRQFMDFGPNWGVHSPCPVST